jgi:1-acyl-sn-glycerol-3-phosphate acyltransferase
MPMALLWTLSVHFLVIRPIQIFKPKARCMRALSVWGAGFAWIMGVRVHRVNNPIRPMGDLIISNHMGFLDIPVMLASFPAVFVIKIELGQIPFFGKCLVDQQHIFVARDKSTSRQRAGKDIMRALKQGARVIVFPEGQGHPYAERLPFSPGSLAVAERLKKTVQAAVIDYLPDRRMLEWDINRPIFPQLVDLFGRFRTHVSIEYLAPRPVEDAKEEADRYKRLIESRLAEHDRERESLHPVGEAV